MASLDDYLKGLTEKKYAASGVFEFEPNEKRIWPPTRADPS